MSSPLRLSKKRENSGESGQDERRRKRRKRDPLGKESKTLGEEARLEEARLEKLVFGEASFLSHRNDDLYFDSKEMEDLDSGLEDEDELEIACGETESVMDTAMSLEEKTSRRPVYKKKRQPAWQDEEDLSARFRNADVESGGSTSIPLSKRTGLVEPNLMWAQLNRNTRRSSRAEGTSDSEDSDDEQSGDSDDGDILRSCGDLLQGRRTIASLNLSSRGGSIPAETIRFRKLKTLNRETHVEGPLISDVRFHPTSTVAAVAGVSGIASIFQVETRNNAKLASVQFERYPVHCARFSTDGSELLVGSKSHAHFFSYDLLMGGTEKILTNRSMEQTNTKSFEMSPCGRFIALAGRWGAVHILTSQAKEWITTFQMTGEVSSMCFSPDGSQLFTFGEAGEVWVWDMGTRTCIHRFVDEGSFGGSCIAVSPSGRFIACGCPTGMVNLYDRDEAFRPEVGGLSRPTPLCTVGNLVTAITSLRFDPSSEILIMASENKGDAVRMFHLPSRSVYCNFPGANPKMNRPMCLDISPHGGFLSIGNSKGSALLYRLSHFANY